MVHSYVRGTSHYHTMILVPIGLIKTLSSFPQVLKMMETLWLTFLSSNQPQPPQFMYFIHFLCHLSLGNFPSLQFPSMHHLSLRQRLPYSILRTQNSYCKSKHPNNSTHHQEISLLMGTALHVEYWSMRFVFGRTLPLVISPGSTLDPDYHLTISGGHPLQSQSCVGI